MQREVLTAGQLPAAGDAEDAAWRPKPHFYLTVLGLWVGAIVWFHPHLATLLVLGNTLPEKLSVWFFVLFIDLAWVYAAYNVAVIFFGSLYRRRARANAVAPAVLEGEEPAVALLYTTCNDFVETSVRSCIEQDYGNYRLYILDDGSDPGHRARIDEFAAEHPHRVQVVRREDHRAYKAGNLNHALATVAREPLFALVDADEILPANFLKALVPRMQAMPDCGFIQANHCSNPQAETPLARDLGTGVDSHWRWYHPLRNDYGFVMLLGHGALIRRQAWVDAGGFPELVSEDLAFAVRAREAGWRGRFAEDVMCFEEFPPDVRAFRVRHMKWTRGTCEFLSHESGRLLRSRRLNWVEKLDILLPTLNLPLSFMFFLFVIDANLVLTSFYGELDWITWVFGGQEMPVPVMRLDPAFAVLNRPDLYAVTLLALLSPVLCFVIDMWRQPVKLWCFLAKSTALYGALGPLSSIGVVLFALTKRAVFHVTADKSSGRVKEAEDVAELPNVVAASVVTGSAIALKRPHWSSAGAGDVGGGVASARTRASSAVGHHAGPASAFATYVKRCARWIKREVRTFALRSHPDHVMVQGLEFAIGGALVALACATVQLPFLGLALAYVLLPLLHHVRWESPVARFLVHVPFFLIVTGVALGSLSLIGVQTVFFGYGFHF
jgi:GT2 family glycosyltransferase